MIKKRLILYIYFCVCPKEHNYPAAESYLSLLYPAAQVEKIIANLRAAKP